MIESQKKNDYWLLIILLKSATISLRIVSLDLVILTIISDYLNRAAKNLSGGNIMKIFKYVLMFMLIASTMALAGCGGDKFAGKWYAINDNQRSISMLDITKMVRTIL